MVLTKKYRCGLQERIDISAYIIPRMDVPATLEPKKEAPCQLIMLWPPMKSSLNQMKRGF
jgi:hypothetical protein